ncbi:hypothetical protein [Candidatus Leptofilum sp.]
MTPTPPKISVQVPRLGNGRAAHYPGSSLMENGRLLLPFWYRNGRIV